MDYRRFVQVPTRSLIFAVLSALSAAAFSVAARVPRESPGSNLLQRDTTNLLMRMDGALAPECERQTIVKAEVIRPSPQTSSPREVEPAGSWQERWYVDRCGEAVAWDVRYAPSDRGGINIFVGLACGESATRAPSGIDADPLEVAESGEAHVSPPPTFLVNNANDGGPGSLAEAIIDANSTPNQNGPDLILFRIPGPGPHTISLSAALPAITDPVVIDGYSQPGAAANSLPDGSDAVLGVELDGSRLSRPAHGLLLRAGSSAVRGLWIHGFDGDGIRIEGGGSNRIEGNLLGGGPGKARGASNAGSGVAIVDSSDNAIGGSISSAGNVIEGNGRTGIRISGIRSTGNAIRQNRIVRNAGDGIDLESDSSEDLYRKGPGPNNLQRPPVLTSVSFSPASGGRKAEVVVEGSFEGTPGAAHRLELFATSVRPAPSVSVLAEKQREGLPPSEGERFLGFMDVVTGEDGRVGFQFHLPSGVHSRDRVTATATDRDGNTSQFSKSVDAPTFTILWNTGSGNWDTAANWDPPQRPSSTDDVLIAENGVNTTFTVTLNVSTTVNSLTLGGGNGTQTLSIPASTLTLNSVSSVGINGVLTQTAGTITGTGDLTIDGTYNWSGGTMTRTGTGTPATTVNGPLNLGGVNVKTLSTRALNTAGLTTWSGSGGIGTNGISPINNTGTWEVQNDASITTGSAGATFNNSTVFRKSAGIATLATTISIPFNNSGSVVDQAGVLKLNGGGASTGSYSVTAGNVLWFSFGTHNLNAGSSVSGDGTIRIDGATVSVNSDVAFDVPGRTELKSGTIFGTGNLSINGPFTWSGGTMSGPTTGTRAATTVTGPFDLIGGVVLEARYLNTNGPTTWTGTGGIGVSRGAIISNTNTWDAQNDASITSGTGGGTFNNSGTVRKTAGVPPSATSINIPFNDIGNVESFAGILRFTGGYTQTAGTALLNGGALSSTTTINILGGTLAGSGTVTGPVVVSGAGVLAPGLSPGALSFVNNYTQQAQPVPGGAFNVEIGGTAPGQYDHADILPPSIATLAGDLNVTLNSFMPASGNNFTIMTYSSHTGSLTPHLPTLSGCLGWQVTYGSSSLVLAALAVPSEVTGLTLGATNQDLAWDPGLVGTETAYLYDVLRGDLGRLPVGTGPGESCLASDIMATTKRDQETPASGHGFWYLVRESLTNCGVGTYGFASNGTEQISTACP